MFTNADFRYPFSRRDLLRAGAAGLVGLGLPLVAPPRARAGCNPGGNILHTSGSINRYGNGLIVSDPFFDQNGNLCAQVTNNSGKPVVLVWDVFDAPNANWFNGSRSMRTMISIPASC